MVIFTFGAYFGLTVSMILGKKVAPRARPAHSHNNYTFAFIGTFFLWMFWPSFNAGLFPTSPHERSVIIVNTIVALTGSCLSTFIMTALLREKFDIVDILYASLAGGVAISTSSGLFTNLAGPLVTGIVAGVISVLGYKYLSDILERKLGLYDTCGIHNLYALPGFFGGIISAIVVAAYTTDPLYNDDQKNYLPFYNNDRSFFLQGGNQIAGLFISIGIAIVTGIIAGLLMRMVYVFDPAEFYRDDIYFDQSALHSGERNFLPDDTMGGGNTKIEMHNVQKTVVVGGNVDSQNQLNHVA